MFQNGDVWRGKTIKVCPHLRITDLPVARAFCSRFYRNGINVSHGAIYDEREKILNLYCHGCDGREHDEIMGS